jgi:hypothetical protein
MSKLIGADRLSSEERSFKFFLMDIEYHIVIGF